MKSSKGKRFKKVAVGGTFDQLHKGHKKLLKLACNVAEHLVIGITNQDFIQDKALSQLIQPYDERTESVKSFVDKNYSGIYEIISLNDPYGITIVDPDLDALVVSPQTYAVGVEINEIRKEKNLSPLSLITTNMVNDEMGDYISSTRIRSGIISKSGIRYDVLFKEDLILNDSQRNLLKHPMGKLIQSNKLEHVIRSLHPFKIAVVGDSTIHTFNNLKLEFHYGIYDGLTQRQETTSIENIGQKEILIVQNKSGEISSKAVDAIKKMLHTSTGLLKVVGEEDLLVLPMILLLSINSVVIYGQPNKGLVVVQVTDKNKKNWYEFLKG